MEYLIDVHLADSGRWKTPAEGLTFDEQYVRPMPGEAVESAGAPR